MNCCNSWELKTRLATVFVNLCAISTRSQLITRAFIVYKNMSVLISAQNSKSKIRARYTCYEIKQNRNYKQPQLHSLMKFEHKFRNTEVSAILTPSEHIYRCFHHRMPGSLYMVVSRKTDLCAKSNIIVFTRQILIEKKEQSLLIIYLSSNLWNPIQISFDTLFASLACVPKIFGFFVSIK